MIGKKYYTSMADIYLKLQKSTGEVVHMSDPKGTSLKELGTPFQLFFFWDYLFKSI
jgi:hypothetical protein